MTFKVSNLGSKYPYFNRAYVVRVPIFFPQLYLKPEVFKKGVTVIIGTQWLELFCIPMLETKKKVFAITNSWRGNFVSRYGSEATMHYSWLSQLHLILCLLTLNSGLIIPG